MPRAAIDVVRDYIFKVWNRGEVELVRDLCTNPITRYEPNAMVRLSHEEQVARIRHSYADLKTVFEDVVLSGDEKYVTLVWNVTGSNPAWRLCGIEIFRVHDGRITEVWNLPYADGAWGMTQRLTERTVGGEEAEFPLLSAALDGSDWELEVPVDAGHIGRWIGLVLGRPVSERVAEGRWSHRYGDASGTKSPVTLVIRDKNREAQALQGVEVQSLGMRLVPSAVVNATVRLRGTSAIAAEGAAGATDAATEFVRLAEMVGGVCRDGLAPARVRDAEIILDEDATASGHVTLDLTAHAAADYVGGASLQFGWRQGVYSLMFGAEIELSEPVPVGPVDASAGVRFAWRAHKVTATIVNDEPPPSLTLDNAPSIETAD